MSEIELRELRYFAAVAGELSFSRAAQRLGMAQSPLSRAIARLESRLGLRLLDRTTRQVTLTDAGAVLLEEAQRVLLAADAAVTRTKRAAGTGPRLVVVLKPGGDGGLLRDILAAYQRHDLSPAEVKIVSHDGPSPLIRQGTADVALLRSPFDPDGLEIEELLTEPRVAALAASHRLAGRSALRRADLAGEPLARWTDADGAVTAYWHGYDPQSLAAAGHVSAPRACTPGPLVSDLPQLLETVGLGQAVAFLPASASARNPRGDVVYRPVTDLSPSVVAVAWRQGSRSPAVAAFVRAAIETASTVPPW
jgi:DNA-binding transcriptional LysR family regulator